MPGFGGSFRRPQGGAGMGTDPIAGGGNSFNPAGGAPGGGGIGTDPSMGGGGGQFGGQQNFGMPVVPGMRRGLDQGKAHIEAQQGRLWQLQEDCARGNGSACIQAQTLQKQLDYERQQHQANLGVAQMGQDRGTIGQNGRGRSGTNPNSMAAAMLGAQFGMGGGGGW